MTTDARRPTPRVAGCKRDMFGGLVAGWHAVCGPCGWAGERHFTLTGASADAQRHDDERHGARGGDQ